MLLRFELFNFRRLQNRQATQREAKNEFLLSDAIPWNNSGMPSGWTPGPGGGWSVWVWTYIRFPLQPRAASRGSGHLLSSEVFENNRKDH